MKRQTFILSLFVITLSNMAYAQKKFNKILTSASIPEIEEFLRLAHPDDPRRTVLRPKLTALKNKAWTKGARSAKPMEIRPLREQITKPEYDAEEFERHMATTSQKHTDKTIKLLNTLFNEDITSKEAILLYRNNSDCNIIVRIQGREIYNLAVPAHGENFTVIKKGEYILTSNVCDIQYSSKKEIRKGMLITLSHPIEKRHKH
ncbi:DUF6759 domain-containing protein [Chryseobacterium sp. MYb264]|uniref:DUF6759 domain-containing protein n=1 Tax=Chryseobacterium sp. MYb264 TaxID=2745153 RepID=UPI002E0F3ADE|nr:DUF6759 domain-containing protein [Chryseobacterium sp. MYb264]